MAKIIDLDQVRAGAEAIPVDPIPSGNDAPCGIDYVCNGNNDGGCTIDWACGGSDGPCLLADHACGRQVVPVELPAQAP
jgi:hypothetical protein